MLESRLLLFMEDFFSLVSLRPLLLGMLVYSEQMSISAKIFPGAILSVVNTFLMKSDESLTWDFNV